MMQKAGTSILAAVITVMITGCSPSDDSSSSFDRFTACVRDATGDQQIDDAIRESCLQKHEELSEGYSFGGTTAVFVDDGVLEVRLSNPYEFLVTNVEIAFAAPREQGKDCSQNSDGCSISFASGRIWLMPKQSGSTQVILQNNFNFDREEVGDNWGFRIQSVRLLRLQ